MLPERKQLLIVDDELNLRRVLSAQLSRDGYDVHTAEDGAQALEVLENHHIDLVLTDLRMPKLDGMELLRRAHELDNQLPVVIITAHGTVDNAVEALKTGAFDYITKPFDQAEVRSIVRKALKTRDLAAADVARSLDVAVPEGSRFGIIGRSATIQAIYSVLDRVADTPTTVLITGESGTGKELVARALHERSSRRERAFIKLNCAAVPRDLMESELFGYERGALSGAAASKPGRLELASGGTLFLDEISAIPLELQVKLLRALQEGELERVGGIKTMAVDVRLIAATDADLKKEVAAGTFREDLLYRLSVVPIRLPALRERVEDLALLVEHFIHKFSVRLRKNVSGIEPDAEHALARHSWPGNIRELENVIERAVLFCDGTRVRLADLPPEVQEARSEEAQGGPSTETPVVDGLKEQVKAAMSRLERELIVRALEQTRSNVTHAARLLKISRKGLQLKMKELGLRERDERNDQ
jgi:DNA-binding NtrC family response regulator